MIDSFPHLEEPASPQRRDWRHQHGRLQQLGHTVWWRSISYEIRRVHSRKIQTKTRHYYYYYYCLYYCCYSWEESQWHHWAAQQQAPRPAPWRRSTDESSAGEEWGENHRRTGSNAGKRLIGELGLIRGSNSMGQKRTSSLLRAGKRTLDAWVVAPHQSRATGT